MTDLVGHQRRHSTVLRDGEGVTTGPNVRRTSKLDSRPSVQYGLSGRRMSQCSRSTISDLNFGIRDFKEPVKLQNTYRMGPNPGERFQSQKAENVMKLVLESYLSGETYNTSICRNLVQQISDVIKSRMKDLGFSSRYKYVCVVIIGQNRQQSVEVASRGVWNTETDNYASSSFSSGDLFAVANIFATYYE